MTHDRNAIVDINDFRLSALDSETEVTNIRDPIEHGFRAVFSYEGQQLKKFSKVQLEKTPMEQKTRFILLLEELKTRD